MWSNPFPKNTITKKKNLYDQQIEGMLHKADSQSYKDLKKSSLITELGH